MLPSPWRRAARTGREPRSRIGQNAAPGTGILIEQSGRGSGVPAGMSRPIMECKAGDVVGLLGAGGKPHGIGQDVADSLGGTASARPFERAFEPGDAIGLAL